MDSMISITQHKLNEDAFTDGALKLWNDWRWQASHVIKDIDTVEKILGIALPDDERERIQKTIDIFPMSITPYYLSLIDPDDYKNDPIFKQAFPDVRELILQIMI